MLNKTLLASALMIALTGTAQAANPNEGARTGDATRSAIPNFNNAGSRSTGGALSSDTRSGANSSRTGDATRSADPNFNNAGSRSTGGALSSNARDGVSTNAAERSAGDSNPSRFNNAGSRSTGGALSSDARGEANADYAASARYSEYRDTSSAYSARGSDFIGADLMSSENGSIGAIDDVIMSRSDNKLHAIIDVGGDGARLVSVPIDDLRMDSNGTVYLNSTNAQLQQRGQFGYNDGELRGMERTMSRRAVLQTPTRQ